MRLPDFLAPVECQALRFDGQHVGYDSRSIFPEGQGVVAGAAHSNFCRRIGIVRNAVAQSLINLLEMLKLVIVQTKEKCRHDPVGEAHSSPMLYGENSECLSEVSLQRDSVERSGIVRRRVRRRIGERRERIFEAAAQPPAGIVKRFIGIGAEFCQQRGQCRAGLPPQPKAVARMRRRKALVDQPDIQQGRR